MSQDRIASADGIDSSAPRRGRWRSPATGIAMVALVGAVSGTAWAAAGTSKPPPAKGNAAFLGGEPALNFTQNVWATETSTPLKLDTAKDPQPILAQPFVNSLPHAIGMLNFAEAQVTNEDQVNPVVVTLRMAMNNHLEPGSYAATIGPGQTQSIFALLKCNGIPKGRSSLQLMAQTTGSILIGTRADDGLRPIVVPPGSHGSRFAGEG